MELEHHSKQHFSLIRFVWITFLTAIVAMIAPQARAWAADTCTDRRGNVSPRYDYFRKRFEQDYICTSGMRPCFDA